MNKKTIFVVYTERTSVNLTTTMRKYAFNTKDNIEVGDRLKSKDYDTAMLVTDVLNKSYAYYNKETGKLSNTLNSTALRKIKDIEISSADADTVIARKIV